MDVFEYICTHIHIYIYIYIYMHIHTHKDVHVIICVIRSTLQRFVSHYCNIQELK